MNKHIATLGRLDHWIDGASVPSSGGYIDNVNPMTGGAGISVAAGSLADVDAAVAAANRAADGWRRYKAADRGRLMMDLAALMRANRDRLAEMERADTGKPMPMAYAEVDGSVAYFEFYGSLVYLPTGDVLDVSHDQHVFTKREPFGIVGVITPWNLPLNQAARAIAPALVAGNVVVAKPSEITSQTTIEMARLAAEAGFPKGVINIVLGTGKDVGEAIVRHKDVRKVAFTGSVGVGRVIGHIAADRIIPLTLELGGKSANIVFDDADLDTAATEAVKGFTLNAGQVCSAGTRVLVQRSVYDAFLAKVKSAVEAIVPGDNLGPIITPAQFQRVQGYFKVAEQDGARCLHGGAAAGGEGFYIQPTVYADVSNDMRIAQEEIFGPVLSIIRFKSEAEAVQIANDSDFGLAGAVWTENIHRGLRVSRRVRVGTMGVNNYFGGDMTVPFGGFKLSGNGRDKSIHAFDDYTELKTTWIEFNDDLS